MGAGFSTGSALVVDNAAGAPGAGASGAVAGRDKGVKVVNPVPGAELAAGGAVESGPIGDGHSGVPAGTLLCARADGHVISASNPNPTSVIITIANRGTRCIRSSTCIFTDYSSRFGSQTSQTVLDIIATRIVLCKLCNRSVARRRGADVKAKESFRDVEVYQVRHDHR